MGPGSGGRCPAAEHPGPLARTPPPPPFRQCCRWGLCPRSPRSPRCRCHVVRHCGGGRGGGKRWGRRPGSAVSGQWSAGQWDSLVSRVRVPLAAGAHPPLAFPWPPLSPRPGLALVPLLRGRQGGRERGWRSTSVVLACRAGAPGRRSTPTLPCSLSGVRGPACRASGHCLRVGTSPAPLLAWGLGLRRRRIPRAVAPVAEGGAQGPGSPVIGLRVRDAEHRPPLQDSRPCWPPVRPSCPNHSP